MSLKSLFSSIICVGVLFAIIYPLKFVFFPYATTRVLLGILGIPLLLRKENLLKLNKKGSSFYAIFILIITISIISLIINWTNDTFFVFYPFSILIIFSACCFWHNIFRKLKGMDSGITVSKYIVLAVDMQMIIVILFFLSPAMKDLMLSFLTEDLHPLSEQGGALYFRVSGLGHGGGYFASGIVHCMVLQICMYNICKNSESNRLFFIISFFFISIIGSIMSRTTLVGVSLSVCYYLYVSSRNILYSIKRVFIFLLVVFSIVIVWNSLNIKISEEIDQQLSFGFEMFFKYFEGGELETTSTNSLKDSYSIYPTSIKTWILGDGMFFAENGDNYMETDNGYMRMVFYFGVIGMVIMFFFNIFMYKNTSHILGDNTLPLLFLILYFIINLKGDVLQIAVYYGLYMFMPNIGFKRKVIYNT